MRKLILIPLLVGAIASLPVAAYPTGRVDTADHYPVVNDTTLIHVLDAGGNPVAGAAVTVVYRPESQVEQTDDVGITNAAGIVRWSPKDVGVVTINASWEDEAGAADGATANISVKFAAVPANGIFIMIFAGLLLLGGSAVRFWRLLRQPDA